MDAIEGRILTLIEQNKSKIIDFAQDIYRHGESGFEETRTAKKVSEFFSSLGLTPREGLAVTGVRADIGETADIALIGELDGISCPNHPDVNPSNGIAHACGHHLQLAGLVGAALALSDPEVHASLGGGVALLAVPAEEFVRAEVKKALIEQGKIRYGSGGKAELIASGVFDCIGAVIVHHVHYSPEECDLLIGNNSSNGYLSKVITLRGRAAHAGAAPHEGINALNAATLGLNALGLLRETYRDEDRVRVHSIITKGGSAVNVVPDEVVVETMVRAKSLEAINDAAQKVDRAFRGAAMAIGANAEIKNLPGYLPVLPQPPQPPLLEAAAALGGEFSIKTADPQHHNPLSTDVGDLSHLMPVLGFTTGGFKGALHSADFAVTDVEKAFLLPAKMMALTAYGLLKNRAAALKSISEEYKPPMTKEQYLDYLEKFL